MRSPHRRSGSAKAQRASRCAYATHGPGRRRKTEAKIALEQPGLSLNEIREIAVWAMLADPSDTAVKAFVPDVIPDWLGARRCATDTARAQHPAERSPS
jgi:hypothetical protein